MQNWARFLKIVFWQLHRIMLSILSMSAGFYDAFIWFVSSCISGRITKALLLITDAHSTLHFCYISIECIIGRQLFSNKANQYSIWQMWKFISFIFTSNVSITIQSNGMHIIFFSSLFSVHSQTFIHFNVNAMHLNRIRCHSGWIEEEFEFGIFERFFLYKCHHFFIVCHFFLIIFLHIV